MVLGVGGSTAKRLGENPWGKEPRGKRQRRNMGQGREMHLHTEDT